MSRKTNISKPVTITPPKTSVPEKGVRGTFGATISKPVNVKKGESK